MPQSQFQEFDSNDTLQGETILKYVIFDMENWDVKIRLFFSLKRIIYVCGGE